MNHFDKEETKALFEMAKQAGLDDNRDLTKYEKNLLSKFYMSADVETKIYLSRNYPSMVSHLELA